MNFEQWIVFLFPYLVTLAVTGIPAYFVLSSQKRKIRAEAVALEEARRKTIAETKKTTADAADVFQQIAIDEALSKSQTLASMQAKIDAQQNLIGKLTIDYATEKAARIELEHKTAQLTGELAVEVKARQTAVAELESLKSLHETLRVQQESRVTSLTERVKILEDLLRKNDIPVPNVQ